MAEPIDEANGIRDNLAPADFHDPVIEAYKKDVDRTLLRENLKLTVEQRILKHQSFHASIARLRGEATRTSMTPSQDNRK
jgi:hypothetical protein